MRLELWRGYPCFACLASAVELYLLAGSLARAALRCVGRLCLQAARVPQPGCITLALYEHIWM